MRNLDTSLLRVFVTVADQASMTATAKVLHLTQGAVSQKMARLEALAGGKLVTRGRRGLTLTPMGQHFLSKARRMIALNDEILSDMGGDVVVGTVRLGLPLDLVGPLFVPILKGFIETFPKVELQLIGGSSKDLGQRLAEGILDLAVLEEPASSPTGECLAVDRLVWVGKPGGTAYLRDPLPISLVSPTCSFRPVVFTTLADSGKNVKAVLESGGLEATMATVRMDIAISALLQSTVPPDLEVLGTKDGLPDLPPYAITLHHPDDVPSRVAQELAHYVRDGIGRLLSWRPALEGGDQTPGQKRKLKRSREKTGSMAGNVPKV